MKKSKDVPEIRFEGFTADWEQRKFEDLAVRSSAISSESDLPRVEYEDIISGTGCLNKDIFAKESDKTGIVFHKGDVLYGKLRPYLQNWFLPSFKGIAVGDFWVLQPQNADSSFLYRLIHSRHFDVVANQSTGTKMPRADWKLVSKTEFFIPSTIDEQTVIGTYFEQIDHLITLHQSKGAKLLDLKNSMLYKLFPKEGEKEPEIRFQGFTNEWNKKKLGICFSERTESFPEGELLSVTINDGIKKFSELNRNNNSNEDKSKYKKVYKGDIAYNSMRMWQGASGYSPYEGIVSPAYTVLSPNEGIDSKCFSYLFKRPDIIHMFQLYSKGITSDNWNLKYPEFKELEIYVSEDYEEQKLIGEYLSKLDSIIELNKEKLEKLKNIKSFLLDKMFV